MRLDLRPKERRPAGDSFRQQHETWRRAYAEATVLHDRFPDVEQVLLDLSFTDLSKIGTYSSQLRTISAPAKAFFAVPCPRTLCLDGGFDLDAIVSAMLKAGAATSTGKLECGGWIDPSRADHARCRLQMQFLVQVRYEEESLALASKGRPVTVNAQIRDAGRRVVGGGIATLQIKKA